MVLKLRKNLVGLFIFLFAAFPTHAADISGVVELSKEIKVLNTTQGALFIFAKRPNKEKAPMPSPPVAVLRVANPVFPLKFILSEKNVMMPGTPFKGPFILSARYSPSGDALDKTGPQGTDEKEVQIGNSKVQIILKK